MADLSRYDDWLAWLTTRAEADPDVLVTWVGGSAVTGGWDEWSDLDVDVLCVPGTAAAVYGRWLAAARAEFDVHDVWEVPEHVWPDGRQCFLTLQERPGLLTAPVRIIDLHLSDLSDQHSHVDVRRHGTPLVLHDPGGLVVLEDEDVSGGLLRFALSSLVRLLRAEHCPWRWDFGLRYLREDLPGEVADRVEGLVPGHSSRSLRELSGLTFAWIDELLVTGASRP